jgi:hypothetical protein
MWQDIRRRALSINTLGMDLMLAGIGVLLFSLAAGVLIVDEAKDDGLLTGFVETVALLNVTIGSVVIFGAVLLGMGVIARGVALAVEAHALADDDLER